MQERDERRETVVAWVVIALLVGSMFFRAWLHVTLFDNAGRGWRYRTSPYIPAQTYSSSRPASRATTVEPQVPLPPGERKARAR